MLRHISKTVGSAMVALCLVSTLATAQSQSSAPPIPQAQNPIVYLNKAQHPPQAQAQVQPQPMTCTKDDRKGTCTAAAGADDKEIVVVGEGLGKGALMTCVDKGNVVDCKPAS